MWRAGSDRADLLRALIDEPDVSAEVVVPLVDVAPLAAPEERNHRAQYRLASSARRPQ